jgi:hypothetical protein
VRTLKTIGLTIFAVVMTAMGLVFLVLAVAAGSSALAFRNAEPCGSIGGGDCIAEEPATVVGKLALTLGRDRNEYLVDLEPGARHRVSLVGREDYDLLRQGDRVRVRRYQGDDIALVLDGRELRTVDHPRYAWASRLAHGYGFTCMGGFCLWGIAVTRGRLESLWKSRRRLARAGPFFILPAVAPLVADVWFEAGPTTIVVLTCLAAVVTLGGAAWTAARAR